MAGRNAIVVGALLGALGVMAGAFGAHGLKERLAEEALGWWQTGAHYQLFHAPAVVAAGLLACLTGGRGRVAAGLFSVGVVVFSGTLYALALGGPRWLGAVTPLGGVSLIAGWIALAVAARRAAALAAPGAIRD
jgi:uncharacterized membrane protein YgdD (TMEM256/DUF423 family)